MQGAAFSVLTIQLLLWSGIKITLSEVRKISPCSCMYNGKQYNLRSLASKNGPKLVAMTDNGLKYVYNPCIPFTLGGACKNVAVCRWADSDFQSYVALGRQDNVTCLPSLGDGIEISVKLIFHQPGKEQKGWITTIKMKCNRTLNKPKFTIIKDTAAPVLQVEHKCCCPDACPDFVPLPTPNQSGIEVYILGFGAVILLLMVPIFVIIICYKMRNSNDNDINDRQQQENRAGSSYELVDDGAGANGAGARHGGDGAGGRGARCGAGARRAGAGADARRGGDRTRRGGGGDDGVGARRGGDDDGDPARRGGGDDGVVARRGGDDDGVGASCGGDDDGFGPRRGGGDRARRGGDDDGDPARRGGDDDGVGSRRGGGGDDGVGAKRGGGDRAMRGGDDDGVGPRRGGDKGVGSRHGGGDRARCDGGGDNGVVARRGADDSVGAKRGGGAGARRGGDGDGARHGGDGAGGAGARCGGGARRGGGGNEEDDKANSMPYVTDDDLVLAVEEQDGKGCSPAIPIPVTTDPEDQCCSDDNVQEEDDVAFRPASHPVEHEEA